MEFESGRVQAAVEEILKAQGLSLDSENFRETPKRVARFWKEFTFRPAPELKYFESECLEAVKLIGYETWGLCPHHLLPVKYTVDIAYSPNGRVLGISKLPRVVNYLLRTLPLQEDLPKLVIDYLKEKIDPLFIECEVRGEHLCMIMRGVKAKNAVLETSAKWYRGSGYEHQIHELQSE